ncbi:unnamed protein product [Amoebophrya sp. A120]|nr:unnamed protein product [Amoebophrya sp. A120]|eukprot:GSA120T00000707001.1
MFDVVHGYDGLKSKLDQIIAETTSNGGSTPDDEAKALLQERQPALFNRSIVVCLDEGKHWLGAHLFYRNNLAAGEKNRRTSTADIFTTANVATPAVDSTSSSSSTGGRASSSQQPRLQVLLFDTLELDIESLWISQLLSSPERGRGGGTTWQSKKNACYDLFLLGPICDYRQIRSSCQGAVSGTTSTSSTSSGTSSSFKKLYYDRHRGLPHRKMIAQPTLQSQRDGTCLARCLAVLLWLRFVQQMNSDVDDKDNGTSRSTSPRYQNYLQTAFDLETKLLQRGRTFIAPELSSQRNPDAFRPKQEDKCGNQQVVNMTTDASEQLIEHEHEFYPLRTLFSTGERDTFGRRFYTHTTAAMIPAAGAGEEQNDRAKNGLFGHVEDGKKNGISAEILAGKKQKPNPDIASKPPESSSSAGSGTKTRPAAASFDPPDRLLQEYVVANAKLAAIRERFSFSSSSSRESVVVEGEIVLNASSRPRSSHQFHRPASAWRLAEDLGGDHVKRWQFLEEVCFWFGNYNYQVIKKSGYAVREVLQDHAMEQEDRTTTTASGVAEATFSNNIKSPRGDQHSLPPVLLHPASTKIRKFRHRKTGLITHEADPTFFEPLEACIEFLCCTTATTTEEEKEEGRHEEQPLAQDEVATTVLNHPQKFTVCPFPKVFESLCLADMLALQESLGECSTDHSAGRSNFSGGAGPRASKDHDSATSSCPLHGPRDHEPESQEMKTASIIDLIERIEVDKSHRRVFVSDYALDGSFLNDPERDIDLQTELRMPVLLKR